MTVTEVKRILVLELPELVVPADQVVLDPAYAPSWMSESDVALLAGVGLPLIDGDFAPSLDVASAGSLAVFSLGFIEDYEVVVDGRSGEVWASSDDRLFANSSLSRYVDASWRWRWIRPLVEKRQGVSEDMYDMVDLFYVYVVRLDARVGEERESLWRAVRDSW